MKISEPHVTGLKKNETDNHLNGSRNNMACKLVYMHLHCCLQTCILNGLTKWQHKPTHAFLCFLILHFPRVYNLFRKAESRFHCAYFKNSDQNYYNAAKCSKTCHYSTSSTYIHLSYYRHYIGFIDFIDRLLTWHVFRKVHIILASKFSTIFRLVLKVLWMKRWNLK
jgi:hypothetical protein